MNSKVGWVISGLGIVAKIWVVLGSGDFSAYLFHEHSKVAYGVGLLLGGIFQLAIPPRIAWKKQICVLMPIVILIGVAHALLR